VSALVDSPRQRLLIETWRGEARLLHLPVPWPAAAAARVLVLQLLCLLCLLWLLW